MNPKRKKRAAAAKEVMPDWSQLPPDLLNSISKYLTLAADYVSFGSVCVSWRASKSRQKPRHLLPQLPWLMFPQGSSNTRPFFDLSSNKIHHLHLPETLDSWCCGSSHGWLVMAHKDSTICLINPLTKAQIPLPPLDALPHVRDFNSSCVGNKYAVGSNEGLANQMWSNFMKGNFIKKAILSASPGLTDDFVIMAILRWSARLAFCKPGDDKWTLVYRDEYATSPYHHMTGHYNDIAYFEGQFYVIGLFGEVLTCTAGPSAELTLVRSIEFIDHGCKGYFVESDGELLLVARNGNQIYSDIGNSRQIGGFRVFKLNLNGQSKLVQLKNIGDHMLFVGWNHSFSLCASSFPGCKGNCVYFTNDHPEGYAQGESGILDFGVFNLHNSRIKWLQKHLNYESLLNWPSPTWIIPSLC